MADTRASLEREKLIEPESWICPLSLVRARTSAATGPLSARGYVRECGKAISRREERGVCVRAEDRERCQVGHGSIWCATSGKRKSGTDFRYGGDGFAIVMRR